VPILQSNKGAACYKIKVVKNWDAISTIYSTDYANGEGASFYDGENIYYSVIAALLSML
jgi:hypothetical protein